ncbi:MAG TPA: hypothetical protein VN329_03165 [Roseomonas sp.]|nr:hypothetical protein [Roseomonas sp.]
MSGVVDQARWGICGFVSVLNALHEDKKLEEFGRELSLAEIHARLTAEVITFLKITEQTRPELAAEIIRFSKALGGTADSIAELCGIMKDLVLALDGMDCLPTGKRGVAVAMPPEGIVAYLEDIGLPSKLDCGPYRLDTGVMASLRNCVVGVGRQEAPDDYGHLKHWVYVNAQGHLLNWAKRTDLTKEPLPDSRAFPFSFITHVIQIR